MADQNPVVLALLVAAIDQLEELHDKIDVLAAREAKDNKEIAAAVTAQLAPKLTAARRAARLRMSK